MKQKDDAHPWLADMTEAAIEHHLGDVSDFPKKLKSRITDVYAPFVDGYTNNLRQKENQPSDWIPSKWTFDPDLADDMRHFFSDYQHIVNAFFNLNRLIEQLRKIDRDRHPQLFEEQVENILKSAN